MAAIRIKNGDSFLVISEKNYDPEIHELFDEQQEQVEEQKEKPAKKKKLASSGE